VRVEPRQKADGCVAVEQAVKIPAVLQVSNGSLADERCHVEIVVGDVSAVIAPQSIQRRLVPREHLEEKILLDAQRRGDTPDNLHYISGQKRPHNPGVLFIRATQAEDVTAHPPLQIQVVLAVDPILRVTALPYGGNLGVPEPVCFGAQVRGQCCEQSRAKPVGHHVTDRLVFVARIVPPAPDLVPLEHSLQSAEYRGRHLMLAEHFRAGVSAKFAACDSVQGQAGPERRIPAAKAIWNPEQSSQVPGHRRVGTGQFVRRPVGDHGGRFAPRALGSAQQRTAVPTSGKEEAGRVAARRNEQRK
jgi:hypothetical protein